MDRKAYEREVIVRIFQISNVLQTFLDKMLKRFGLTSKQFFMMIIIGSFEEDPTLGDIAERFETSHQNVKQVLLKLEKLGFVDMYKDGKDSRITRTCMSEKANAFWQSRNEADDITMEQIFSTLDDKELTSFHHVLLETMNQIKRMNSGD